MNICPTLAIRQFPRTLDTKGVAISTSNMDEASPEEGEVFIRKENIPSVIEFLARYLREDQAKG